MQNSAQIQHENACQDIQDSLDEDIQMHINIEAATSNLAFHCNRCRMETYFSSPIGVQTDYFAPNVPPPPDRPKVSYRVWICTSCQQEALLTYDVREQRIIVPPRQIGWRQAKRFKSLDNPNYEVLLQGYLDAVEAFNVGMETICTMGIRACMEWICNERGCTEYKLEMKLNQLLALGFVSPSQHQALNKIRYIGNAAAHGMKSPGREDLERGLVILESLIDSTYEVIVTAQEIKGAP